jgi:hypothetical protein
MSRFSIGWPDWPSATAVTVSTNVPDGQSGPVVVKVDSPVAKLMCSVIVNGTCSAAWADATPPAPAAAVKAAS